MNITLFIILICIFIFIFLLILMFGIKDPIYTVLDIVDDVIEIFD